MQTYLGSPTTTTKEGGIIMTNVKSLIGSGSPLGVA